MRNKFIKKLVEHAKYNENIALIVGDLGYSVVEEFADQFPERFFNAGVAEQNMAGLSAGLASEGLHVFAYSIANFPTFRCAEQIRNDIDYHRLPVTMVSVGAGLSYGNMGYSHHAIQDMGLMRLFPNMLIAAPADPNEVDSCLEYLIKNRQTSYLRLGKSGEANLTEIINEIKPGAIYRQRLGRLDRKIILTTGAALELAYKLVESGKIEDHSIYTMPLWGQMTRSMQGGMLDMHDEVITVENHILDGGFGSWLSECSRSNSNKIRKFHINSDVMYQSASNQKLLDKFIVESN
jgi:transketolase